MWRFLSRLIHKSAFVRHVLQTWHDVKRDLLNPYRPELHYMRGPGPKWQAKWPQHIGAHDAFTDMFRKLEAKPAAARAKRPALPLPLPRIDIEPGTIRRGKTIA